MTVRRKSSICASSATSMVSVPIEDAEELLIRAVDRLILFGQGQDRGEIVVHERGGGGAQHAIDAGSLLLDKGDHLRRKLDIVVDLALGRTGERRTLSLMR